VKVQHAAGNKDPSFWDVGVEHKIGDCQRLPCVDLGVNITGMFAFFFF
jgi:hypothetical protein